MVWFLLERSSLILTFPNTFSVYRLVMTDFLFYVNLSVYGSHVESALCILG